jgi:hypothetical protein
MKSFRATIDLIESVNSEILYHGSNIKFDRFDVSKRKTAFHIYTTPSLKTAQTYGKFIAKVQGNQQPQADLSAENFDYTAAKRIWQQTGITDTLDEFVEILEGDLYGGSGSLQNEIVDGAFSLGYKSVRFDDVSSQSVVFDDPEDVKIIEWI